MMEKPNFAVGEKVWLCVYGQLSRGTIREIKHGNWYDIDTERAIKDKGHGSVLSKNWFGELIPGTHIFKLNFPKKEIKIEHLLRKLKE